MLNKFSTKELVNELVRRGGQYMTEFGEGKYECIYKSSPKIMVTSFLPKDYIKVNKISGCTSNDMKLTILAIKESRSE